MCVKFFFNFVKITNNAPSPIFKVRFTPSTYRPPHSPHPICTLGALIMTSRTPDIVWTGSLIKSLLIASLQPLHTPPWCGRLIYYLHCAPYCPVLQLEIVTI